MKLWKWFLLLGLSCTRRDGADRNSAPIEPQAEAASPEPVKTASPANDVVIATRWLEALRDGDQSGLGMCTRYPFELHDDGGNCKDQTASSPEQLASVLHCLLTDAVLLNVLQVHDSSAVEPLPDVHLARWAQKWHVASTPNLRIVSSFFGRNDTRAQFELWVGDGGIRGVWKSGVDGSREVELVIEWLAAVKDRDLERLARVTSYPLEVRDTGRDARCGKRTAKGRDTLAAVVDCLFRSDRLHQAIVDSPSSRFVAHDRDDPLANWIEPWWRESNHRGLRRVFALIGTNDGYEYDFQMLVARDGVRVVWKLGSFESQD